jgi:flagellar protein FlgJ
MSISPPSDIILDVARAADPVREQQALARLHRIATGDGETFEAAMTASAPVSKPRTEETLPAETQSPAPRERPELSPAEKTFRGFEAMALASMIESAMPKEGDSIFGSGTAGSVWKSMLAEQIGEQMAEAGGIGIARQLASSANLASAASGSDAAETEAFTRSLLVTPIERGFVSASMGNAPDDTDHS